MLLTDGEVILVFEAKGAWIKSVFLRISFDVLVITVETFADDVVFDTSWFCVIFLAYDSLRSFGVAM